MGAIGIVILFIFIFFYILYQLIKWISKKKTRVYGALTLLGIFILINVIYNTFFVEMEFVQSKVYPDLYLITNPVDDRDLINKTIKQMVYEKVEKEFIGNEEKYKVETERFRNPRIMYLHYGLRFYEYYSGWGSNPFGEAGTAHFINHEEDPGGFSSELLENYEKYRIADFHIQFCKDDTVNYYGVLDYYRDGKKIRTDTIINHCNY